MFQSPKTLGGWIHMNINEYLMNKQKLKEISLHGNSRSGVGWVHSGVF